jgi:hypothetical protein
MLAQTFGFSTTGASSTSVAEPSKTKLLYFTYRIGTPDSIRHKTGVLHSVFYMQNYTGYFTFTTTAAILKQDENNRFIFSTSCTTTTTVTDYHG